jgi:predicted PurR-regulated permease PerM
MFTGLYFAKAFLVPICFAGLFAILFLPLSRFFQQKGLAKGLAILICIFLFLILTAGIVWLISWQVTDLTGEIANVEQKARQIISGIKQYISNQFGISQKQQDKLLSGHREAGIFSNIGSSVIIFILDWILVLVYIFLFMYYRGRIKKFILQVVSAQQKENAEQIMYSIQKVSQQYLMGLGMMIACLWVMYSIGFSIVGVKHAVVFAILCGLLEIVPFVGNLTGNFIAILMVVAQGGSMDMVIGIVITYAIIQFLQTYILEPLVVGVQVNINPLFTVMVIVLGELVWGIPGMVLAIPLLGIAKIICDHIEPLKPYGFLIGKETKKKRRLIGKLNRK